MADQAIYAPMIVLDENGLPVPGARAFFYASGTNTLIDVFSDEAGTVLATNPVVADGAGYLPQRFVDTAAKVVLQRPTGETLRTLDPAPRSSGEVSAAAIIPFNATVNIPQLNVQAAIEAVDTGARARETAIAAAAQPLDADLTAIAGITRAQGDIIRGGATTWEKLAIGTVGRVLRSDGTTASWDEPTKTSASLTMTGAGPFEFTSVPAWVSRITINLDGVSLSGTDDLIIQLGTSASYAVTGYTGGAVFVGASNVGSASTTGFMVRLALASRAAFGVLTLSRQTGNTWVASHVCTVGSTGDSSMGGGSIALAAALTRIRIAASGTDTFDGGATSVNWF